MPVVAAGLDAVFPDQMPDDLFEGDAAGGEVETRERPFERVVGRRGEDVEVAAGVAGLGVSFVVVLEHRARIIKITPGLVGVCGVCRFKAQGVTNHLERHLDIQVHPVAERRGLTAAGGSGCSVAYQYDIRIAAQPHVAKLNVGDKLVDLADAAQEVSRGSLAARSGSVDQGVGPDSSGSETPGRRGTAPAELCRYAETRRP